MKCARRAMAAGLVWIAMMAASSALGSSAVSEAIEREMGASAGFDRPLAGSLQRRKSVQAFYDTDQHSPAWFTPEGTRPAVAAALDALRTADAHGLEPADYGVDRLAEALAKAAADPTPELIARADVALTAAVLGFLADLHDGRARPQDIVPHYRKPATDSGLVARLRAAVGSDQIPALVDAAQPSFPVYGRLKRLLARYRTLATQPWSPLPAPAPKRTKVDPGEDYEAVAALHDRLALLGDLPVDADRPPDDRYSEALVAAVRRFQERHGLTPDGILGRETLAALNVPLRHRVDQITLSLERLRWLPELAPGPLIAVNIPSFRLWAFADARASAQPALTMPVIVGRAVRTETPVFLGAMRYVEFSPYWNVPPSILRGEILPSLRRDAAYLRRHDMELVSAGADGTVTTTVDAGTLAALESGALRARQRPGARNALDGVKFVLPNTMNIYLHGTPAAGLFGTARRDFSHGCIRVADPAALARFVLRDQPEWTAARIESAMSSGKRTTVNLPDAIPVVVFYTTAIAGADDRALFLADIYGHDRKLAAALRAAREDAR